MPFLCSPVAKKLGTDVLTPFLRKQPKFLETISPILSFTPIYLDKILIASGKPLSLSLMQRKVELCLTAIFIFIFIFFIK